MPRARQNSAIFSRSIGMGNSATLMAQSITQNPFSRNPLCALAGFASKPGHRKTAPVQVPARHFAFHQLLAAPKRSEGGSTTSSRPSQPVEARQQLVAGESVELEAAVWTGYKVREVQPVHQVRGDLQHATGTGRTNATHDTAVARLERQAGDAADAHHSQLEFKCSNIH